MSLVYKAIDPCQNRKFWKSKESLNSVWPSPRKFIKLITSAVFNYLLLSFPCRLPLWWQYSEPPEDHPFIRCEWRKHGSQKTYNHTLLDAHAQRTYSRHYRYMWSKDCRNVVKDGKGLICKWNLVKCFRIIC